MDNAFRMLSDLVSNLTSVIIGILGLGIVGSLAFGDMLGLDVIGNITSLVESLASNGVLGPKIIPSNSETATKGSNNFNNLLKKAVSLIRELLRFILKS